MDKGCYLGQELTARTFFRGVTRKRVVPVTILGPIDADATYISLSLSHIHTEIKMHAARLHGYWSIYVRATWTNAVCVCMCARRGGGGARPVGGFELAERLAGAKIVRMDTMKAVGVLLDHVVNRGIGLVRLEAIEGAQPPPLAVGMPTPPSPNAAPAAAAAAPAADADDERTQRQPLPPPKYRVHAAVPTWWPVRDARPAASPAPSA
jgi:hypothetical protein